MQSQHIYKQEDLLGYEIREKTHQTVIIVSFGTYDIYMNFKFQAPF